MSFSSTALTDAITAGLAQQFAPNASTDKEVMDTALEAMRVNSTKLKAEAEDFITDQIFKLSAKLTELKASGDTFTASIIEARMNKLKDL